MHGLSAILLLVAASAVAGAGEPRPREPAAVPSPGLVNSGRIAAMIAAAAPGSTVIVPPGVYVEHLRIEKPIRLVGGGPLHEGGRGGPPEAGRAVIDGGGSGDIVEIVVDGVEVRGFVIRDTGIDLDRENCAIRVTAARAVIEDNTLDDVLFGIDLKQSAGSVVRNNRIGGKLLDIARRGDGLRLWRCDNAIVEGNTIHDGRDAILWYSTGVTIRGNCSTHCRYGLHLMFSDNVTLEANELRENSVGVYFMYSKELTLRNNRLIRNRGPSGYGLGLKEADLFQVEGNVFVGNRVGVYIDGSPFTHERPGVFTGNTFAGNDIGMTLLPSVRGNVVAGNNFLDNIEQVCVQGRGELTGNEFAASGRGNFWSDYTGYDADGDGLGDYTHEPVQLFENLLDREPQLRILLYSPAQQAIEFVGRALPVVQPEPKFTDPYPLMRPVPVGSGAPVDRNRVGALAGVGAGLCGVAGLIWLISCGDQLAQGRPRGRVQRAASVSTPGGVG